MEKMAEYTIWIKVPDEDDAQTTAMAKIDKKFKAAFGDDLVEVDFRGIFTS
jgi:hypothetical protein